MFTSTTVNSGDSLQFTSSAVVGSGSTLGGYGTIDAYGQAIGANLSLQYFYGYLTNTGSAAGSFAGTINSSSLTVSGGMALTLSGNVTGSTSINVTSSANVSITGNAALSSFTQDGTGTTTLSGNNNVGYVSLDLGTLKLGSSTAVDPRRFTVTLRPRFSTWRATAWIRPCRSGHSTAR